MLAFSQTAWQIWKVLLYEPFRGSDHIHLSQRFVITVYDNNSAANGVDEAELLAQKQKSYDDYMMPIKASLVPLEATYSELEGKHLNATVWQITT